MEKEKFDPKDEQYKEVADLPPEHQEEFMDVKSGGFVTRDAILNPERAEEIAHRDKEYEERQTDKGRKGFEERSRKELIEERGKNHVINQEEAEKIAYIEDKKMAELLPIVKRLRDSIKKQGLEESQLKMIPGSNEEKNI